MTTLKDAYKDYFYIGAAAHAKGLETHRDLLSTQFSSMTCENEMKHMSVAKAPGEYDFTTADKMVDFAKGNGMQMRGHCMVWHAQAAPFLYKNADGSFVSRDTLIANLKAHIHTYAQHFKGRINAYDVVNEAIDDKNGLFLRRSFWTEIIGDDFLDIAFTAAALEDSEAKLFYNDYNEWYPDKSEKILKLVKGMLERGVPISGLGLQSHYNVSCLNDFDNIRRAYERYAKLGIDLHVTELDVSCFDPEDKRTELTEPTAEMTEKVALFYEKFFAMLREYKGVVKSVTFWGIADDYTWLDNFPVRGRKNWPLLFDINHQPKEAFWRVAQF